MTDKTKAEILWEAGHILQDYIEEVKQLRKDASHPKQIAFLEAQLKAFPDALLLIGFAAGRDSLKRQLSIEGVARFDEESNRE